MYLAIHCGRPCRVTDVATDYGISRNHLLSVALELGRLGYLKTARGRTGSIALALPPEEIVLGDVVRQMEDGFDLTECMRPGCRCAITRSCRFWGIVGRALDALLAVFDGVTLAEIAGIRKEPLQLLALNRTSGKDAALEPARGRE